MEGFVLSNVFILGLFKTAFSRTGKEERIKHDYGDDGTTRLFRLCRTVFATIIIVLGLEG